MFKHFISDEAGAVTVDWVVLTAAIVGLGIASSALVSNGIKDLAGDVNTHLRGDLISSSFLKDFSTVFSVLQGVDGVTVTTNGNAYVNGSEVRFIQGVGGAIALFGSEAFGDGVSNVDSLTTSAHMDWGRHGEFINPLAISFGDPSTATGGYGSALSSGVSVILDPKDSTVAVNWNGTQISKGPVGFDLVNTTGGDYGMAVSKDGTVSVTALGQVVTTATIPDTAWTSADKQDWDLSYATSNSTTLGWMYGRDFEVSGSGSI